MRVCDIVKYGVFDSTAMFPGQKETVVRTAANFEIEYILSGGGVSYIDYKSCAHVADTVLLRKPQQKSYSILPFRCLYIYFDVSESSEFYSLLANAPNFFQMIDSRKYKRSFEELMEHLAKPEGDTSDEFVMAKMLELFYYMKCDTPQNKQYLQMYAKPRTTPIVKAMDYMNEHMNEQIRVETLAEVTGYSTNYFQDLFRKLTNETPQKYLLRQRIGKAKQLLADSEYSLSEIAQQCGFSSQSYFGAIFKKETGYTPMQFRRRSFARYMKA